MSLPAGTILKRRQADMAVPPGSARAADEPVVRAKRARETREALQAKPAPWAKLALSVGGTVAVGGTLHKTP